MRTRAKALTVAAAMVTTFVILPTFGAAAAEPLEDGSYDVVIGEATHTVDVLAGVPAIEGAEGVEFTFAFDDETNRVLDEFVVTVGGVAYDVAVADDGTVTVTEDVGEEPAEEPEDDGDAEVEDLAEGDDEDVEPLEEDDEAGDADDETLEESDEDGEALEDGDEVDADGHGAIVSTVAQCAANGKQARAAGLPNHGFFVSAAAKGEVVEFEADGETHSADLSSQEGADAFCQLADELLAAAATAPEVEGEPGTAAAGGDEDSHSEDAGGKGRGNGNGRANAPGQLKKNG